MRISMHSIIAGYQWRVVRLSRSRVAQLVWPAEARCVRFEGQALPPAQLRECGSRFWRDAYFLHSAAAEADRLRHSLGLGPSSRVLEIGCGAGRTAIGLLYRSYPVGRFVGIDVDRRAIEWCRKFISASHPQYHFSAIDAKHERWNPHGAEMTSSFSLPFDSEAFDIVYLHSVFSNLPEKDVRIYAREFQRLLSPNGTAFLTAFVEEGVPPVTINPENYVMQCHGPLNIVRYEKSYLFSIFAASGLAVERFDYGKELDGQSGIYLRKLPYAATRRIPNVAD